MPYPDQLYEPASLLLLGRSSGPDARAPKESLARVCGTLEFVAATVNVNGRVFD